MLTKHTCIYKTII